MVVMVISLQTTSSSFNFFPIYNYTTVIKRYYSYMLSSLETLACQAYNIQDIALSLFLFSVLGGRMGEGRESAETLVIITSGSFHQLLFVPLKKKIGFFRIVPPPNELF